MYTFTKNIFLGSLLAALLFVPAVMFAQEETETTEPETTTEAGVTPDSPWFFLDIFGESIREFFAFNDVKKARLRVEFAEERVAELRILIEEDAEDKAIAKAERAVAKNIAKVSKSLRADDDDSDDDDLDDLLDDLDELDEGIGELTDFFEDIPSPSESNFSDWKQVLNRITQAKRERVRAMARIDRETQEGSTVSGAQELFDAADELLGAAEEAFGAGLYDEAEEMAHEAKSLFNDAREGRNFKKTDDESGDDVEDEMDDDKDDDSDDSDDDKDDDNDDDKDEDDISVTDLPQVILDYVADNYDSEIVSAEKDIEDGEYEIVLMNGTKLEFDLEGNFIEESGSSEDNDDSDEDDEDDDSDEDDDELDDSDKDDDSDDSDDNSGSGSN